jgi:protein CpxP
MIYTLKNIAITVSLCSALVLSTVSYASNENPTVQVAFNQQKYKPLTEKRLAKLSRKLDLTESQQADIKVIKEGEKWEMEKLKPAMQAFRQQVKTLMSSENFDEQAFIELQASNQDVFAQVALIKAKSKFAMKEVLTTEQQEDFNSMPFKRLRR